MAWRTNCRDHNGSAAGCNRAQRSLRADFEHFGRDCRFCRRLYRVFPVIRHSLQIEYSFPQSVSMEVTMSEQLKNKIADPKAHFDKPKDVVQDGALSHQEKKKALNTWEQ